MKLVVFGLAVSSSWGNGHATLWRGLGRALSRRGHRVAFFERDVPYYAACRDMTALPGIDLHLYPSWRQARDEAAAELADADVGIVTSFCPDAIEAAELLSCCPTSVTCFYDMDTPVTLDTLANTGKVDYIGERGLHDYDLVLSYTGGGALRALEQRLGARRACPLYGSVDPEVHRPDTGATATTPWRGEHALSYLGTYADDRQAALDAMLLEPARRRPDLKFLIGGAQYPADFPWLPNIDYARHVAPAQHAAFYAAAPLTINITRAAMAAMGYCPSARLFEAAACGQPVLSDAWEGLSEFFTPEREILIARSTEDVLSALARPRAELEAVGSRARDRVLREHTADHRAIELERLLAGQSAFAGRAASQEAASSC
jgi:spore maturation protein CgeB